MKTLRTTLMAALIILSLVFFLPPAHATKIGIVMDDHSGPEYYPAQPDGNQCIACDQGMPYSDGYDHSADGYFSMKYFLSHLVNMNGAVPGFVADDFDDHGFGIILMDKDKPSTIVSGTPTLIDAWGKEGLYVNPAIPGADPVTGYITYTKLYTDFLETDGTHLYIWPEPYPYPTGNPAYPANKAVMNDGSVPFYIIPRDAMNAYEDTTFTPVSVPGGWSLPVGALYLEGPLEDPAASGRFYPDNNWQNMLGWEYDNSAPDFFAAVTDITQNAWAEHDFYEFTGFDAYTSWHRKGGREVYMEEVTGEMNQVKDWLWANYGGTLTGGAVGDKDDYIKVAYMIDPCFCNGENPKDNIHGRSLYNAVYNLITMTGVDKIIVHDHFVLQSQMMNDDMGWHMIMMAIDDANMMTGGSFSMDMDVVFAPGHPHMGDPMMSPFADYYKQFHLGSKPVRELLSCGGWAGPTWSSPPYPDKNMWVGGVALRSEYIKEVVKKAESELSWAIGNGASDIAMFLSNHGTPTTTSWCFDSVNEYLHYNNKLAFVRTAENILSDPAFIATFGSVVSKAYEPYALSTAEITDLEDQMDMDDLSILDHDIQRCKVLLSTGRRIAFLRVSGQDAVSQASGGGLTDPGNLVYSPREAINYIMDTLNPTSEWNVTHIVDLLYNFMGQSGDLLWDQRYKGYGEKLLQCPGGNPTAIQRCKERTYLFNLSMNYPNPIISDSSNPNAWSNYLSIPEQYCYPTTGYGSSPCWDFGHDNLSCPDSVPAGCYVSFFDIYNDATDPKYDPVNTPAGLRVKITNGDWGWDGKVLASRNIIREVLDQYFGGPTVINLASFEAIPANKVVVVKWTTASEIDTAGFNIYRSTTESGGYVKINDSLIPAKGDSTNGSSYSYIDKGLQKRATYYYKLEDIDNTGKSTLHGPVSVTTGSIKPRGK